MDYIQNIRKKVGKDKIILNFTCGILSQSGKILLQKRADKGTWGLPGGAIELGESALEALVREFYEETGIEIRTYLAAISTALGCSTLAPEAAISSIS